MIRLASGDGHLFQVDLDVARGSGTIATMLEELDMDENGIVPLPSVKGHILEKVINYAVYHKNEPAPERDAFGLPLDKSTDLCEWDLQLFNNGQPVSTMYEILLAAKYLEMKGLFEASCKMVASLIKGKTPEQIRETFNIKNDLDPNEINDTKIITIKATPIKNKKDRKADRIESRAKK